MPRYVVLLRGVNVGGRTAMKMADLRGALVDAGLRDVRTVLQSGNAVFVCPARARDRLETAIEDAIERRVRRRFDCHVRSALEWDVLIAANPFPHQAEVDPSHLVVMVGRHPPDAAIIEQVQATHIGPERLEVVGDALYIVYPDGIGRSKLMNHPAWREREPTASTARNWNTVLRIATLLREAHPPPT